MGLAKFEIKSDGVVTEVVVNGQPVPARRLELTAGFGPGGREVTTLTISLPAEGVIEGEGIVQIDTGATSIDDFLASIDPEALEQDVLMNTDGNTPVLAAAIAEMRRRAQADAAERWAVVES